MGYHEEKAAKAWAALAEPFKVRTIAAYRQCKTVEELRKLSRECWREHDHACRTINRNGFENMTRHGTAPYDKWSALAEQARVYAVEFYKKAQRIDAGESLETVMPHLKKKEV